MKGITLKEHLSKAGRVKSKKKAKASRKNGLDHRPHFVKARHFEKVYPYELINNEWKDKFPTGKKTATGRDETYNPDYYCPTTGQYIELATSQGGMSQQGPKWSTMLKKGLNLQVYWWDGSNITKRFS